MVKILEHDDVQPVGEVESSAEIIEAVAEHIEAFFGEANFVVREKTSQHVQLDVHVIEQAHDMGAPLKGSILFTTG